MMVRLSAVYLSIYQLDLWILISFKYSEISWDGVIFIKKGSTFVLPLEKFILICLPLYNKLRSVSATSIFHYDEIGTYG
jgi:hypothetical protein